MAIRKSIRLKLQSLAGVTATCEGRVFWQRCTRAEDVPCLIYQLTGGTWDDIDSCLPTGPQRVTVEVYALSRDPEEAIALGDEIVGASGLHGASWTQDSTTVQLCRLSSHLEDDFIEEPFNAYVCGGSFEVSYTP